MLSRPVMVRYSSTWRATLDFSVQSKVAGSVISWQRMETRSVPPFFVPPPPPAEGSSLFFSQPAMAKATGAATPSRVAVRRNSRLPIFPALRSSIIW